MDKGLGRMAGRRGETLLRDMMPGSCTGVVLLVDVGVTEAEA